MKTIIFISFFVLLDSFLYPQNKGTEFIESLIKESDDIEQFINADELKRSNRLGINYDSVKYKFLISYDIDEKIKGEIKKNGLKYEIGTHELENGYSLVLFNVPSLNYSRQFYFKNNKWVSPVTYFSKDWTIKTSKYFIFKISVPKYFNDYCIKKLDEFVDSIVVLLDFDENQKQLLEKEKIYYILCKDEKEIEQVTGFNTRGMFITAFDEVVTTYNTHYHELAHLLINFKLKNLSLYTLPFFMEGFAVAVGGRGGIAKGVVLDIGYYLQKTGFLTYDSIITNDGFYKEDASLTYPVAGLYNAFLMDEMGVEGFIKLYRQANGSLEDLKKIDRNKISLPDSENYNKFLKEYCSEPNIYVDRNDTLKVKIYFHKTDKYYKFFIEPPLIFSPANVSLVTDVYISKKYEEIFRVNEKDYKTFKYGITADSSSVSIYNFYTNEIIASYSTSFSLNSQPVPVVNRRYEFFSKKNILENDLDSAFIVKSHGR